MITAIADDGSLLERIAADELARGLELLGEQVKVVQHSATRVGEHCVIALGTAASSPTVAEALAMMGGDLQIATLSEEGFCLKTLDVRGGRTVLIAGGGPKGALYGAGRLLRDIRPTPNGVEIPDLDISEKPAMALRGIFWAAYAKGYDDYTVCCCAGEFDKLRGYLAELALRGMNAICLTYWLDDPGWYVKTDPESRQRQAIAAEVSRICRELELKVVYWWPVNTVPREWWEEHPELRATEILGLGGYPAFCPSHPEGRRLILKAREEMFAALPPFDILHVYPKDIGGCGCERCRPFHVPYAQVALATLEVARKFNPNVELMLNLWYLTADEQENEVIPLFVSLPDVTYVGAPVNFNRLYPRVHQISTEKHPFLYGGPSLLNPTGSRQELDASFQLGLDVVEIARAGLEEIRAGKSSDEVREAAGRLRDALDGYRYYDDCRSIKDVTMGLESITPDCGWVTREESSEQTSFVLKATCLSDTITVDFTARSESRGQPGARPRT